MNISKAIGRVVALFPLLMPLMFACGYLSDHPISAEALAREFKKDPSATYKKYEGQELKVSGVFEGMARVNDGTAAILLKGGAGHSIMCSFEDASVRAEDALLRLKYGRRILVKGHVLSIPQNSVIMSLHKCQLLEAEDKA